MKKLLVAVSISTLAFASAAALAQGNADTGRTPTTAAETAQFKAERAAAKNKWATMTPDQKAAVRKSMQQKKLADLSALELVADDDVAMATPAETAKLKSEREAARAKWATMSPEEKAAMRKAASQKKYSELTTLEKVAGSGS